MNLMTIWKNQTPIRKLLKVHMIAGGVPILDYTVTGNPVSFQTNLARPLSGFTIPFLPVQQGTGDPSPENNIRPISGWTGVTVVQSDGSNAYDKTGNTIAKYIDSEGVVQDSIYFDITDYIPVVGGVPVLYDGILNAGNAPYSAWYDAQKQFISSFKQATGENVISVPNNAAFVRFSLSDSNPDDVNTFAIYTGTSYPVTFPETVYGGTLDAVNRVLTVAWAAKIVRGTDLFYASSGYIKSDAFDAFLYINDVYGVLGMCNMLKRSNVGIWGEVGYPNTFRINANQLHINIANDLLGITDYTQETTTTATRKLKAWLDELYNNGTPLIVVYPISTPYEIPLSDIPVPVTLIGNNTIWTDANGENTIKYKKKG